MSSRQSTAQKDSKSLRNRTFFILPQPGSRALKALITSNGGTVVDEPRSETIFVVEDESVPLPSAEEFPGLASLPTIYKASLVNGLILDPAAINEEHYILAEGRSTSLSEAQIEVPVDEIDDEDAAEQRVARRKALNRSRHMDSRRLYQSYDELDEKGRAWLRRSREEYLSAYYCGNIAPDNNDALPLEKICAIPPHIPCCEVSPRFKKEKLSKDRYRDLCFAPPVALSDAVRATDPIDRNYMPSEDFALLVWFTRTIPYCGSIPFMTPEDEALRGPRRRPNESYMKPPYGPFRWNWARTHGVCLRPVGSLRDRWSDHVKNLFLGKQDLPHGTFRHAAAESKLFWFENNRIVGFRVANIKRANEACRLSADAPVDKYCVVNDADKLYDSRLREYLVRKYGDRLHGGQLFDEMGPDPEEEQDEDPLAAV